MTALERLEKRARLTPKSFVEIRVSAIKSLYRDLSQFATYRNMEYAEFRALVMCGELHLFGKDVRLTQKSLRNSVISHAFKRTR